jgi:hypothetical protein
MAIMNVNAELIEAVAATEVYIILGRLSSIGMGRFCSSDCSTSNAMI